MSVVVGSALFTLSLEFYEDSGRSFASTSHEKLGIPFTSAVHNCDDHVVI